MSSKIMLAYQNHDKRDKRIIADDKEEKQDHLLERLKGR